MHFDYREVLNTGKRLARERDEMCRELRRLHESTLELHDKMIMEIQVFKRNEDNDDIISACNALHEKWQHYSRQWFSSNLAEAEHKLWIADESWRTSRTATGSGPSSLQDHSYPQRNLRDRIEEMKGRSLALPSTSGAAALASSSEDEEAADEVSNDYEDLDSKSDHQVPVQRRISANIAQRKKLATPSPSHRGESRTSLDESVYSSLSNDVYTKIASPKHSITDSSRPLMSESGTASVIEVIEPTASEEAEFKKALQEMNWSLDKESPITIFPRDELRSSILTTTSSSPMTSRHHARPVQIRSPTSSKTSRESIRSRYSSNGELSPTKRLLEMGIVADIIDTAEPPPDHHQTTAAEDNAADHSGRSSRNSRAANFLQKIASKTKLNLRKRSPLPQQMYANIDDDPDDDNEAEEHILPDSFDEVAEEQRKTTDDEPIMRASKSSVSPSSRKSASSHTSKGSGSEDSGIGIPVKTTTTAENNNNHETIEVNFKLGKIEEASVTSSQASRRAAKKKESLSKAWYDVPSDDDTEAPEADSLASIISHRGSSDDD
jgi:hypothetical protein